MEWGKARRDQSFEEVVSWSMKLIQEGWPKFWERKTWRDKQWTTGLAQMLLFLKIVENRAVREAF